MRYEFIAASRFRHSRNRGDGPISRNQGVLCNQNRVFILHSVPNRNPEWRCKCCDVLRGVSLVGIADLGDVVLMLREGCCSFNSLKECCCSFNSLKEGCCSFNSLKEGCCSFDTQRGTYSRSSKERPQTNTRHQNRELLLLR